MNGASLVYKLEGIMREGSTSAFFDERTTYDYLYEAAKEFSRRTGALTGSQDITTVASQSTYDLEPSFIRLYFLNSNNELVIKYTTSSGVTTWIKHRDYDRFMQNATTTAVAIPQSFTIRDKHSAETNITGTASSGGALTYEESALNDATAPFADVAPGDSVHNTTDGSIGIVTA